MNIDIDVSMMGGWGGSKGLNYNCSQVPKKVLQYFLTYLGMSHDTLCRRSLVCYFGHLTIDALTDQLKCISEDGGSGH